MKVAFATKDGEHINDHFGWAKQFSIYDVSAEGYKLVEHVETPEDPEDEDDKISIKIQALKDSSIMYCEAIGPTAAAKVVKARIHPIKVKEPKKISEELDALVELLKGNPPPWIKRIIARDDAEE